MSPRMIALLVGAGLLLWGLLFELIAPTLLAHGMVLCGVFTILVAIWPRWRDRFAAAVRAHQYQRLLARQRAEDFRLDDLIAEPARTAGVQLEGPGSFAVDVVGESRYQRQLDQITGGKTDDGHNLRCVATLVLENDNTYDPNAVRIEIAGKPVGYLDRAAAKGYRKLLDTRGLAGRNLTCAALILGGWDRGHGDTGHYGVKLDLPQR